MLEIHQVHLRAVMLFMSETSEIIIIFNIHRIWKALSLSFPKLFRIENPLSIKEVMSQNVCVCSFPIFDIFDIHSITPLMCTLSIFDIFDIALIFCTVFNAFNAMYLNTSNIKQCALTHIDTCPLMYTQQIRWQWVTMGVNEWLPHYLIWSGSCCYSNFNSKWLVVWRNNPK